MINRLMLALEKIYKTDGHNIEDLAKRDGRVAKNGPTPFGFTNAVYIEIIAYGVHEIMKPTMIKIITTVEFLSIIIRRFSTVLLFLRIF